MIDSTARQIGVGLVAIALLMTAAIALARTRDAAYPLREVSEQTLYFTSPGAANRLALEYRAVAADLYWIRTLQYFGDIRRKQGPVPRSDYRGLYPLLDLTTSLDPYFNLAYRFGAIFLSEPPPAGPGRPDLAISLLEKGLRVRPDKWEYMLDIGFVHYWWNHDYKAASAAFLEASTIPGAPVWLRPLAATTAARGGDRRSSRTMWLELRQSAEIDWLQRNAERNLAQLDALDAIDLLQARVDQYRRQTGAPAADWAALVRGGFLRAVPIDPAGTPYALTRDGRVQLSGESPLWPLPVEPGQSAPGAS